ncbi:uncharacterized protein LOC117335043 [Pecten maximus]|uniref:uncharacterized protein LOC117335043 n=1 Tax=Pecten maximus TaxID=6579 RepID=UPI001459176C|nr:uncharacterized protein LOC117335043 [Pecten maximus]
MSEEDFQEVIDIRVASFVELMKIQQQATEEISQAQAKQKMYYDNKNDSTTFKPGDLVLLKNKRRINRKGDKILSRWTGPFTIKNIIGKGVFSLENRKQKVNIKDMKRYRISSKTKTDVQPQADDSTEDYLQPEATAPEETQQLPKPLTRKLKSRGQMSTLPSRQKMKNGRTSCPKPRRINVSTREKIVEEQETTRQESPMNIQDYVHSIDNDIKEEIFTKCKQYQVGKPEDMQSVLESPTFSLIKDADDRFSDDMMDCESSLLSWYMMSASRNLELICELDPFVLSSALLTIAYHDKINPKELLPTLDKVPLSKISSANSPNKLPKSSLQMCVGDVTIHRQDLTTLYHKHWLNDQVILAYLSVLRSEHNASHEQGCYVLPCFITDKWESGQYDAWLYPQIPLEKFEHVLVPVCHQQHWFLLAASMKTNTVNIHDSLPCQKRAERFCRHWMNFMAARKCANQWNAGSNQSNRQADGHSCGVFVLMNAEAILQDSSPAVMRQCHTQHYRKHILKRLLAESSPHNKTVCDLPFCSMLKPHKRHQCARCCKWVHKKCLGLTSTQSIPTCVFCQLNKSC